MSIVATASVKVLGDELTTITDHCTHPVYCASIHFGASDVVWLTNGTDNTELPPGATTGVFRMRPPTPRSTSLDPAKLSTTIGGGSIDVVDINGEFTQLIKDKKLTGVGSRKAKVYIYEVCTGETVTSDHITHVLDWYDQSYSPGVVTLELKELIYTTKETVLSASSAKLAKNHATSDTSLRVFDIGGANVAEMFPVFAHTSRYRNQRYDGKEGEGLTPSQPYNSSTVYNTTHEAFGYVRIKATGAIICHSGFRQFEGSVWEATIIEAGALGTTDSNIDIDENIDSADNFPDVEEVIYAEETGPEWVSMIWTGRSINGNRVFPWGQNINRDDIDLNSLAILANTPQTVIRVITSKPEKGKTFLQDEILPIVGAFIDTRKDGKLTLKTLQTPTLSSTPVATLDHGNSEVSGSLKTHRSEIYNEVVVLWGYNEASDSFKYRTVNNYLDSAALYGNTPSKEIELKWLQPGMQTDASLRTIIDRLAMQFAFERVSLKVKALPTMGYLRKGEVVFCDYAGMRDSNSTVSNSVTLQRPMLITGVSKVKGTRQVVYSLMGYTKRPKSGSNATDVQHLGLDQIQQNGTRRNLAGVCNISNGDIVNPTSPIPAGKYYYDGDLTAINTVPYEISGYGGVDLWLPTDKHFQDNSTGGWVNLRGKGIHAGGKGAVAYETGLTSAATPGERGFFGSHSGGGGVEFYTIIYPGDGSITGHVISLNSGAQTSALYDDVPDLELRMENGIILGLPDDMSGSGGSGGGYSSHRYNIYASSTPKPNTYIDGADGGRGGGWLRLLCGSFGYANGTQIDLSGADAQPASTISYSGRDFVCGPGSGGAPGAMQLLLPRGATPPDLQTYVKAQFGSPGNIGNRMQAKEVTIGTYPTGLNHSYYAPPTAESKSGSSTVTSEIPIEAVPEEPPSAFVGEEWRAEADSIKSDLDALFNTTMRSNVVTHYQADRPTGATEYDYWAEIDELDAEGRPKMLQLINRQWSLAPAEDAHAALIATNYANSSAAERAQITADGKSKTIVTDEADRANWPEPSGYGDLLYVKPLSQVYRCENGTTWDINDTFVDEMAVTSASNIMIDGGFSKVAFEGKKTWKREIPECTWYAGKNGYASYPTLRYGAFGEGGSAGARVEIENTTNTDYSNNNDFGAYLEIHAEKYHEAKLGDIFRVNVRGMAIQSPAFVGFGVNAYDKDKNFIGKLGDASALANNGVWVTKSGNVEVNSNSSSVDLSAVQFVRGYLLAKHYGINNSSSKIHFDHVSMERANIWSRVPDVAGIISTPNTLPNHDLGFVSGSFINIYNTLDEVEITFAAQFKGDGSGDAVAYNVGIGGKAGSGNAAQKLYFETPETNLVVGSGAWKSVYNRILLKGIPPGDRYSAGYGAWGSAGTQIKNAYCDVKIRRG